MKNKLFFLFLLFPISVFGSENVLFLDYSQSHNRNLFGSEIYFTSLEPEKAEVVNKKDISRLYLTVKNPVEKQEIKLSALFGSVSKVIRYTYTPSFPYFYNISQRFVSKQLQKKPLSCELSVTADILSYLLKKSISEDEVFSHIPKLFLNKLPFQFEGQTFWGNPDVGFVGYMDYYGNESEIKPTQRDMTGYGVYEQPIANVYKQYGFHTTVLNRENQTTNFTPEMHLTYLLKNLAKGNMVQLWGDWCTREEYEDGTMYKTELTQQKVDTGISGKNFCSSTLETRKMEWYYIDNYEVKKQTGLIGEHAFYLLGYEGGVEKPKKIIVWDSDTGYHKYDTGEWLRKWGLMDYRSIIIYK